MARPDPVGIRVPLHCPDPPLVDRTAHTCASAASCVMPVPRATLSGGSCGPPCGSCCSAGFRPLHCGGPPPSPRGFQVLYRHGRPPAPDFYPTLCSGFWVADRRRSCVARPAPARPAVSESHRMSAVFTDQLPLCRFLHLLFGCGHCPWPIPLLLAAAARARLRTRSFSSLCSGRMGLASVRWPLPVHFSSAFLLTLRTLHPVPGLATPL